MLNHALVLVAFVTRLRTFRTSVFGGEGMLFTFSFSFFLTTKRKLFHFKSGKLESQIDVDSFFSMRKVANFDLGSHHWLTFSPDYKMV